jgi:hypothetical protein
VIDPPPLLLLVYVHRQPLAPLPHRFCARLVPRSARDPSAHVACTARAACVVAYTQPVSAAASSRSCAGSIAPSANEALPVLPHRRRAIRGRTRTRHCRRVSLSSRRQRRSYPH